MEQSKPIGALVIVDDPTGTNAGRSVALDCTISLHENVTRHVDAGGDYDVWLNGDKVEDPASVLTRRASALDVLTLVHRPGALTPFQIFAIAFAASAVIVALMPKPQVGGLDGASGQESPNNRLTGQTNVARTYEAIPSVYGKVRCWPDLIQNSSFEYIDNIKRVTEWLCVSEGKGTLSAFQYADTPILDIADSVFQVYEPTPNVNGLYEHGQTTIEDVLETFDSPEVNGQEIEYPNKPITTAGTIVSMVSAGTTFTYKTAKTSEWDLYLPSVGSGRTFNVDEVGGTFGFSPNWPATHTITSYTEASGEYTFTFTRVSGTNGDTATNLSINNFIITPISPTLVTPIGPFTLQTKGDRLRWHFQYQRGLKGTVQVKATWWAIDDSGVEIGGTRQDQTDTMTADSYNPQFFTFNAVPSAGLQRYRFQFERITTQIGTDGFDVCKLEEVSSARYFSRKTLPGVTIVKVVTTATTQATGYSERKFNCEFERHVLPLDGGPQGVSRNFARIMRHIWTVAGRDPAQLDLESLQSINDAHGEENPLLMFDYTFADKNAPLGERLQMVADHARCLVYRDGNSWVTVRDELRPLGASRQFDYRNLAKSGESSISESGHIPSTEDGVEVEHVADDGKTKAYVRLRIMDDGSIVEMMAEHPRKLKMPGCRNRPQAMNRAQLEARKIIYQRRRVSDTALMDAVSMGIGEVVRWIDPNDFLGDDGLQAGEVLQVDGLNIKTSEPLDFMGESSGRIVMTTYDGTTTGQVTCTPRSDGVNGCVVSSVPAGVFVAGGDMQCGSRYAFAVGMTESELESAGLYTLESKRMSSDGKTVAIELASYDERFYEMD